MNIVNELTSRNTGFCEEIIRREKIIPIHYTYVKISDWRNKPYLLKIKRTTDIIGALTMLFLLLPVSIVLAILVKLTTPGPVIYTQRRIGKNNKPFQLYKFRSMVDNAENGKPVCARKNDPRITFVGKWMRKTHLDEIPNLINVLKGDMALVGPRPERPYFIDKILVKAPQFKDLLTIKPGVTSWGQVKFGYAQNVDEMVNRMLFDLEYLNNNSLKTDLIIICWTTVVILKSTRNYQ